MLLFHQPSPETIRDFLAAQAALDPTYAAVGATAVAPTAAALPPGYAVNHTRTRLGEGEKVFQAAKNAIRRWEQFRLGWVEALPAQTPIQTAQVVAVAARTFGLCWLNAARILYVIDEADRFGFAYGTLPDHVASGEERFLIEWDRKDGGVWYDILAFSRPRHFLVRMGYLYMRIVQKRFAKDSTAVMRRAVELA